ncbi:GntR family transcriptional regulator [Nesterenkonia suensis]
MTELERITVQRPEVTLRDRVIDGIRDAITSGALRPGQRLTERELIEQTGVSRTSVREALTHLHAIGLVESTPGRGFRVPTLDEATVNEVYEVRAALEPAVAYHFVNRATDEEFARLLEFRDSNLDLAERLDDARLMDDLLIAGARNSIMADMLDPLRARIQLLRHVSMAVPGRSAAAAEEMDRICEAVARRDAEGAWKAVYDHVEAARKVALTVLSETEA